MNKQLLKIRRITWGLCLLFLVSPAFADIGLPMLMVTMPSMLIALIPIIVIEAAVLFRMLIIPKKIAVKCAALSNVISTLVGMPITWVALVILQICTGGRAAYGLQTWSHKLLAVTWQAPWLIPYESDFGWMIPLATMVLLIPFFFVSWFIEYKISAWYLRKNLSLDRNNINKGVFYGNLITYGLLEIFALAFFVYSILS